MQILPKLTLSISTSLREEREPTPWQGKPSSHILAAQYEVRRTQEEEAEERRKKTSSRYRCDNNTRIFILFR